jgi:DNA polymerase-3 subunit delta'
VFRGLLGNEPIAAYLEKALQQGTLPHALLFSGLGGIGKSLFAKHLAIRLLDAEPKRIFEENHPDFHPIRPEGKSGLHSIETLRGLIDDSHSAPFESSAKVFLLYNAERMQPAAANALLKTLEEPTSGTYLILLTSAPHEILSTILSRVSYLRFQPLPTPAIATLLRAKGLPESLAPLAHGSAGRAFEIAASAPIEEALFPLLARPHSILDLAPAFERLEKAIENEDPVLKAQNAERLFSAILMWHRDQIARKLSVTPLFYPDAPQAERPLPSFEKLEKSVSEARMAYQRNMKLSCCLERLFVERYTT